MNHRPNNCTHPRIEWALAREGQRLTCHVLQLRPGEYALRLLYENVRFFDMRCGSLHAAVLRSFEVLDTLRVRGWATESHAAQPDRQTASEFAGGVRSSADPDAPPLQLPLRFDQKHA
jgi:hypothetical protein